MSATIPYTDPVGRPRQYPQSFQPAQTAQLLAFVADYEHPHATMIEVVKDADLASMLPTVVRHDVDHSLQYALDFAKLENRRGIRSSYFILHTAWYFRDFNRAMSLCLEIQALGHEVGLHHDATTAARDRKAPPAFEIMLDVLGRMRQAGLDVCGCAAHASGLSLDNLGVWNEWRLEDFGLDYEAYHVHREFCANYISDNKGELRRPLEHVDGKPTHLLVHPEHWNLGD